MKIGIEYGALINGYEKKWGKEEGRKKFLETGFSCVDFSLAQTEGWTYNSPEDSAKKALREIFDDLKKEGIEISQIHGPWRYPPKDYTEADRCERLEKMKRSIRMCGHMGCKRWVIHPIMPFGTEDVGTGNEEKTWEMNKTFMSELLKTAKEENVLICFENMPFPNLSLASPESILKFVEEMDDDSFRICLDTGHANIFPEISLGDVVRHMGDKLEALHVHDNDEKDDRHWIPSIGTIDWEDFGKALTEIDFKGVFSYETEISEAVPVGAYELMNKALVLFAKEILGEK
ncbi:MAG: sugar phosphate isomerase/epimerase [Ruminococcaceae bacterium]|nr:sugar phosphate isomerase/epimerase [Oscillospiraceae bacterium]